MAELSELAGTAGLEVAGSTYQRVLQPNPRTYIGTGKVWIIMVLIRHLSPMVTLNKHLATLYRRDELCGVCEGRCLERGEIFEAKNGCIDAMLVVSC